MRPSSFRVAALLGAALSFLPGCESTKASSAPPLDEATREHALSRDADGWTRARVGDRVTYDLSATQGAGPRGGGAARTLAGQLSLEVVAVRQPWVWVRVAFTDEAGKPPGQVRLPGELVLPMRSDATRPLEVPHAGQATAERASLAGRAWEAVRFVSDQRPVDGPLRARLYANAPGPLYLTGGLLEARTETAGFHVPGGFQVTLRDFREGSADGDAPVPALEQPLGPGAYYERRVDVGPAPGVQRVCFTAERGYVLRTEGPAEAQGPRCADFSEAVPEPLEEVLVGLPWEALSAEAWPPVSGASAHRGTFLAEGHEVPALVEQHQESADGVQRVFTETYAAEPWAPALAGLPLEARFLPLASATERVAEGGPNEPEGGTRLVRWGSWLAEQE